MGIRERIQALLGKFRSPSRWTKVWQEDLNTRLQEAQRSVGVNMVVVVARESDFYAELLFLASALGLGFGITLASIFGRHLPEVTDLLLFPLSGFAFGSFVFAFRGLYLHRIAARAVRERVSTRAKSQFFDHEHHLKGPVVLLYLSELEREALLLYSGSLVDSLDNVPELGRILDRLVREYRARAPMDTLGPALGQIGEELRLRIGATSSNIGGGRSEARLIGISDNEEPSRRVPILKGNKDVN